MKFSISAVSAALLLSRSSAFLLPKSNVAISSRQSPNEVIVAKSKIGLNMALLDQFPNPFGGSKETEMVPRPPSTPPPVSNEPEALFSRARAILATDLGLADPSFLAEDFVWIGPDVVSTGALNKEEYLAAGKFFDLRGAFPDLDYRAHDFRLDPDDPLTVRFTARTVGTMRGELRLRSETLPPNGVRMVCPPEAISMTFDSQSGKLVKLCSGFTMDRLVGNTGGLCGVTAAATIAGAPPSEWEIYPPAAVVSRFFGRSVKQIKEPEDVFLAPFPESVMIQLTKGVLASELGTKDPELLSEDFTFCGPIVGPLKKKAFLEAFSNFKIREALPDLEENYSNFRVDPYDPYRVWYDVKATGTRTGPLAGQEGNGAKYIGPPEVGSMTFDDNGICTRLTAGAVMDPTYGNTGGLGGVFGIFYATGVPLPAWSARPLPQILARAQKAVLGPITQKDVDDFANTGKDVEPIPGPSSVQNKVVDSPEVEESKTFVVQKAPIPKDAEPTSSKTFVVPKPPDAPPKKILPITDNPTDPVTDAFTSLFGGSAQGSKVTSEQGQKQLKQNKEESTVSKQKAALVAASEERTRIAAEKQAALAAKKQAAEEKRLAAIAKNEEKKKELEKKREVAAAAKGAKDSLAKAKKGATISLGFLTFGAKEDEEVPKPSSRAPRGVPTLSKWYQNSDGSITAQIAGSNNFKDGELITTSPIKTKPELGTVVVSVSGSKYFLDENPGSAPFFNFGTAPKKAEPIPSATDSKATSRSQSAAEAKKAAEEAKQAKLEAAKKARAEALEKMKANLEAKKLEAKQKREALLASKKVPAKISVSSSSPPSNKKADPKALALLAGKQRGSTISLKPKSESKAGGIFGLGPNVKEPSPPRGVPVISNFKQNRDGSLTGLISGSTSFKEGEKVTTSKLAPGQKVQSGNVVTTVSGSKYFLK